MRTSLTIVVRVLGQLGLDRRVGGVVPQLNQLFGDAIVPCFDLLQSAYVPAHAVRGHASGTRVSKGLPHAKRAPPCPAHLDGAPRVRPVRNDGEPQVKALTQVKDLVRLLARPRGVCRTGPPRPPRASPTSVAVQPPGPSHQRCHVPWKCCAYSASVYRSKLSALLKRANRYSKKK